MDDRSLLRRNVLAERELAASAQQQPREASLAWLCDATGRATVVVYGAADIMLSKTKSVLCHVRQALCALCGEIGGEAGRAAVLCRWSRTSSKYFAWQRVCGV